jgi:phospholipase C
VTAIQRHRSATWWSLSPRTTFDNYFGTYPNAANIPGEQSWIGVAAPKFVARKHTPEVNGLTHDLLTNNPNRSLTGGPPNPQRLRPADAFTCSMDHDYTPEQQAVDSFRMDNFPQNTSGTGPGCATDNITVMNYYDGNTVTALWNYAQHFAMSDNSFGTNYGPPCPATSIWYPATPTDWSCTTLSPTPASTSTRSTTRSR